MHLPVKRLIFSVFIIFLACSPRGPLTPEDSFKKLKQAYEKKDSRAVEKLLSKESIEKIKTVALVFSRMEERQINSLSDKYGVKADKLKNLSVSDYLALNFIVNGERDVVREATKFKVLKIDRKGKRASITVENGMNLIFVKEGPYWKFDMSDL